MLSVAVPPIRSVPSMRISRRPRRPGTSPPAARARRVPAVQPSGSAARSTACRAATSLIKVANCPFRRRLRMRFLWGTERRFRSDGMTYVVNDNCIKCKYTDCVEVCPVVCFYEGANMLVIHPDECIDCGVCEPECPVDAIKPDTEPGLEKFLELNAEYAKSWPNITVKKEPPEDAKEWEGKPGKLTEFDPEPGTGD